MQMEMTKISMDIPRELRVRIRTEAGRKDISMQAEVRLQLERAYGMHLSPDGERYLPISGRLEA